MHRNPAPPSPASVKDAIRDGRLGPYQVYKAQTVKTAGEGGVRVQHSELDRNAMDASTRTELEPVFGDSTEITVDPSVLERTFTTPERNRAVMRDTSCQEDHWHRIHQQIPAQRVSRSGSIT